MTDECDENFRQKIFQRFHHIFESPDLVVMIPVQAMGAPPRKWIPKAINDIEELIDSGKTINESCREVARKIAAANNIESQTVEMTYRRHQREYWHEEFCRCVITKDIEGAVTAYKRLTPASKRKLRLS